MWIRSLVCSLVLASCFAGCATYNDKLIKKVDIQPPQKRSVVSYSAGEVQQLHNGTTSPGGLVDTSTATNALMQLMLTRWEDKGIVSSFGKPGDLKTPSDYDLSLSGQIQEQGSMLGAFITGFTMYLIPSSFTMTYQMEASLTDTHTKKLYKVPFRNATTIWQQIFLAFVAPFSESGTIGMANDTADYLYSEFKKQGAFN